MPQLGRGLNRTSVGLKRLLYAVDFLFVAAPQSNQRGIETVAADGAAGGGAGPQSNQRGIETLAKRGQAKVLAQGLNRTSVGLKRVRLWP